MVQRIWAFARHLGVVAESRVSAKVDDEPAENPKLSSSGEVSVTSPHSFEQMGSTNRGCRHTRPRRVD